MTARNVAHGDFGHGGRQGLTSVHWAAVVLVPLVVVGLTQAAITQWLAGRLGHQPGLGSPLLFLLGRPIYAPFAWRGWVESLSRLSPSSRVPEWAAWLSQASLLLGVYLTFKLYVVFRERTRNRTSDLHGSADWATPEQVRRSGLLVNAGVIVGSWYDPAKRVLRYLWHNGPGHVLLFAPTRSGKGVGVVLPSLVTWRHSVVCLDPKDENFDLTSGWRARFSRVMRLNWARMPDSTAHYNPLAEVRIGTADEVRDVQLAAESLLPDAKGGDDANHFVVTGRRLLASATLHVLYREKARGGVATFRQVAEELVGYLAPHSAVAKWASQPYPKGAEWHTAEGSDHVVALGKALGTRSAEELSPAFERAARQMQKFIDGLPQLMRKVPVPIPFGVAGDLHQVGLLASNVLTGCAGDDSLEHAIIRAAVLTMGYRRSRRGDYVAWVDLLAELRGEANHLDVLHAWKSYPHDASAPFITANGVDYIRAGASQQLNRDERERGAVLSTAARALEIFGDENVAVNSARSDFSLLDLVQGETPMTLYLALRPGDQGRLGPLVRLFLSQLTIRLMEQLPDANSKRHRLLMLLDELPLFGRIRAIEEAVPVCAGYGIKLCTIIQNIEQLEEVYGRNSAIFANSEVRAAYAPNTYPSAQLLSNMAGRHTAHVDTHGASLRPLSVFGAAASVNVGQQEVGRPLIDPGECMTMPPTVTRVDARGRTVVVEPGRMLVFVTGLSPIRATKVQHYADPVFADATSRDPVDPRPPLPAAQADGPPAPLPRAPVVPEAASPATAVGAAAAQLPAIAAKAPGERDPLEDPDLLAMAYQLGGEEEYHDDGDYASDEEPTG